MLAASLGEQVDAATAAEVEQVDKEIAALEQELVEKLVSPGSIAEIDAKMAELEARLLELYDYRDYLLAKISDPNTDFFDVLWLEWDLCDVEWEIASLEYDLGRLGEELWESLTSFFSETATIWGDVVGQIMDFRAADFKETLAAAAKRVREEALRRHAELKLDDAARAARQELEEAERGRAPADFGAQRAATPEPSPELARALKGAIDRFRESPSREGFERLREDMRKLRGA
jgi:hypothetical protein